MDEETKWLEAFNLNEERESFSPMETAKHFYRLKTKFLWSDENLARQSTDQYKRTMITYLIALNKLPEEIQDYVHEKKLGVMPAYELSRLSFDVSFPLMWYFLTARENPRSFHLCLSMREYIQLQKSSL